jgi:hypothetical protein
MSQTVANSGVENERGAEKTMDGAHPHSLTEAAHQGT